MCSQSIVISDSPLAVHVIRVTVDESLQHTHETSLPSSAPDRGSLSSNLWLKSDTVGERLYEIWPTVAAL